MDGLSSGFRAPLSGMASERRRMQVIAMNIANANTIRKNGPYVRRSVVFEEVLGTEASAAPGGVAVSRIVEDTKSEHPRVHNPGHPAADAEGYVRLPNVNIMAEQVDLLVARRAYAANLAAYQTYRSMLREVISQIGGR